MLTWVMVVWAQAAPVGAPAVVQTRPAAGEVVPLETRLDKLKAERQDLPAPVLIEVRNEMGNRFRLVEARFIIDGVEVAQQTAPPGKELADQFRPMGAQLPAGPHVLTAELVYEGRNAGPFRYLDDIRYRVESTLPFQTGHLVGPATVEVVARERPGANVPFEKKPLLTMTATNTPGVATTPEKVAPTPRPADKAGVKPASAITH
jgi:hypothetical protein